MSLHVRAAPKSDWPWLVDRTGCALTSDFNAIEAIQLLPGYPEERDAYRVRGMVGYCNTTRTAVQLHMAVDAPCVWRALLGPALRYPFLQAQKRICLGVIPASNPRSLRFAQHVGFRETYRIADGWDEGCDLVFLELRREECRYLELPSAGVAPARRAKNRGRFRPTGRRESLHTGVA